jgi:hypothetical protein
MEDVMTRVCRKCNAEKPIEEFTKHKGMSLGYDTICLVCNNKHARAWAEENRDKYLLRCKRAYRRNRAEEIAKSKKRHAELEEEICSLKKGKSCLICGYDRIYQILHFHHRDPSTKKFVCCTNTNRMKSIIKNRKLLEEEIAKCDLLCPTCHAEVHFKLRQEAKARSLEPINEQPLS